MARRRSHRRSSTPRRRRTTKVRSRRRRVGATALNLSANSPLVKWGSVAVGYLMADKINAPILKMVGDKVDSKIIAGAEVGLGFLLAMKKGKKNMATTVLGGLLLGAGAKSAMKSFGIGGIGPYGRVPVVAGIGPYGRVPVIAGQKPMRRMGNYSPNASLNGYSPSGTINSTKFNVMGSVATEKGSGSGLMQNGSDLMN